MPRPARDQWSCCDLGHRHWGRDGAAGLLLRDHDGQVLLTLRARRTHLGGTWSIPGGALGSPFESARSAALRETREELGLDPDAVRILGRRHDRPCGGGWTFTTVLAKVRRRERPVLTLDPLEVDEVRWVAPDDVADLPLHPGFGASWPKLRRLLPAAPIVA